jgi:hypothetical protein
MRICWLISSFTLQKAVGFTPLSYNHFSTSLHAGSNNKRFFMDEVDTKGPTLSDDKAASKSSMSIPSSKAQRLGINTNNFQKEVTEDATNALASVGWSAPMMETELTSDDPFVQRINAQLFAENGVGLDGLLNPAKV